MEIIIGIIIVIAVGIIIVLCMNKKDNSDEPVVIENQTTMPDTKIQELVIHMEELPADSISDKNKLVEITDSKVLACVNNLVPEMMQVGNVINNSVQSARENGEVLYRAIIPAGAKLTNSQSMEGAVRGIYHGADGIRGHANLVAVEAKKGSEIVANSTAAAMGVASMVVGQYYMNQINSELGVINEGVSKISGFQDNEYRSRVFSLINHVKSISDFQVEILENSELRLSKISQLDSLEEECTKLLGQANLTLMEYPKKNDLEYGDYEKELPDIQNWYMYQNALMEMLCKISDLKYTLHLGFVSREHCTASIPTYSKQVCETQKRLAEWHNETVERLNIDINEIRRKRKGIDKVIHFIPGLFKEDLNFKSIEENTVEMIKEQSEVEESLYGTDTTDLYAEDVQLISKDGKLYYLPEKIDDAI